MQNEELIELDPKKLESYRDTYKIGIKEGDVMDTFHEYLSKRGVVEQNGRFYEKKDV